MPHASNYAAGSHIARFRERGIHLSHARYASVTYEGRSEEGVPCALCGYPNIIHIYKLRFEIPIVIMHREDGDSNDLGRPPRPITSIEVSNTRIEEFYPVGSECIYNWAEYIREMGGNSQDVEFWQNGPVAQVQEFERSRGYNATIRSRINRLDAIFRFTPNDFGPCNLLSEWISQERRNFWAANYGDVRINRLIEVLEKIAAFWNNTPWDLETNYGQSRSTAFKRILSHNLAFYEGFLDFNPITMCACPTGRVTVLCNVCARPYMTVTNFPGGGHWLLLSSVPQASRQLECALCGTSSGPIRQDRQSTEPSMQRYGGWSYQVRQIRTENDFNEIPESSRLSPELRAIIRCALRNSPGVEIIGSIAEYALRQGRVTIAQLNVLRSRADIPPGTPECPTHHILMRRVQGRRGPFYSCPFYPNCSETRNIPVNVTVDNSPDIERPVPVNSGEVSLAPIDLGGGGNRHRRRNLPRPAVVICEQEIRVTNVDPETIGEESERSAMEEQAKIFKRVLVATIIEKCR